MNFILSVMEPIGQFLLKKMIQFNLYFKGSLTAIEAREAAGDHLGSLWNEMMNMVAWIRGPMTDAMRRDLIQGIF